MAASCALTSQHTTQIFFVACFLAIMCAQSWAYNCSSVSSPWIYINESSVIRGSPILYRGEPLQDINHLDERYPSFFLRLPDNFMGYTTNSGALYIKNDFNIDDYIPEFAQLETITGNYYLSCNTYGSSKYSFVTIVIVDENDENPVFTEEVPLSINLSEDTCKGQEIYNFAYGARDRDFADKPNEEKLQLIILDLEPTSDTFSVTGRLGIQLEKVLNKSLSPYVLTLRLQDQALNYGPIRNFTVHVTEGQNRDASYSNILTTCKEWKEQPSEGNGLLANAAVTFDCRDDGTDITTDPEQPSGAIPSSGSSGINYFDENCKTLNDSNWGYSGTYNCYSDLHLYFLESKLYEGREITYRGYPIHAISALRQHDCFGLANSSNSLPDFLNLTDGGALVVKKYFNLDDVIETGIDGLTCGYSVNCPNTPRTSFMRIFIFDENDEEPSFTSDTPNTLNINQEEELVYNFESHVHDKDYADTPNDRKLELVIISFRDSCGKSVPEGVIAVTKRLGLKIQFSRKAAGCSPYLLTLSLKDHAMRFGPYHNLTLHFSTVDEVYCETQAVNVSKTRVVTLPRSREHSLVELPCLSTGEPLLVARCERLSQDSPQAEYVIVSKTSCNDNMSLPKLIDLYLEPLTESNVVNVTMEIEKVTNSYELQPADLIYVSRILNNLAHFFENSTNATELLSKVSPSVAGVLSNLMEANVDVLEEARSKDSEFTSRIIGSFDTMLLKLTEYIAGEIDTNTTTEDPPAVQRRNLAYQVTTGAAISGLGTCSLADGTMKTVVLSYNSSTQSDCVRINGLPHVELKLSRTVRGTPRAFVVYTNAVLFGSGAASEASVLSAQLTRTPPHGGSSGDEHVVFLRQRIHKATVDMNGRLACGYWNFITNLWDTDGCSRKPSEDEQGMVVCTCDHLTNFAVLMVPCMGDCGGTVHDDVLGYLSLIFLTISCVALLLLLVTFFVYRKQRQGDARKLTACLSASLLCMNLLFIFGISAVNDDSSICSALAVVLHYFLLASFLFMTAEVILSYIRLVKVLDAHVSYFIWKVLAVCLGVPAGVVIGVRFGNPSLYVRSDQYCWVQPTLQIYGVMVPVGLVIAFNLVMFVLIARALKSRPQLRSSVSERKQAILRAKALGAVFVVLGITWAFGLMTAIEASSVVFQYLFVISNALQGLFVFIFHAAKGSFIARCLKNVNIRKAVGFTGEQSKNSDSAGGDMSLSTIKTTNGRVSGRKESSGATSDSSHGTSTTNSDVSGLRL